MEKSKYLAVGLSALLVLSLASCGGQQAQEPQEPKEPTQEIQQAEPISTQPVVAPEEVKQEVAPAVSEVVPEEGRSVQDGDTSEEVDGTGEIAPAEEDQLFTPVEEMVYATGTVNIRASWSVESEKLGALSKGDAVTRTGTAIEGTEADGWSRVKISDGRAEDGTEQFKEVYVSTRYLSTTKPAAQQQATTKPTKPSSTQQQQTTKPSSGKQQSDDSQSLASLLEGLVDEDGYSIGHRDKDRDWSGYESSNGYQPTWEETLDSWS